MSKVQEYKELVRGDWKDGISRESLNSLNIPNAILDIILRLVIVEEWQAVQVFDEQKLQRLQNMFHVVLDFIQLDILDQALPYLIYEELFEASIDRCRWLWSSFKQFLDAVPVDAPKKPIRVDLALTRILNGLLKRLTKSEEDIEFAAQVLNASSVYFASNEKSGVNLKGEFASKSQDPIVSTKRPREDDEPKSRKAQRVNKNTSKAKEEDPLLEMKNKVEEDFERYFNILQTWLAKPPLVFEQDNLLVLKATYIKLMQTVIQKRQTQTLSALKSLVWSPTLDMLDNASFRRQILSQSLILFDFLLGYTESPANTEKWAQAKNTLMVQALGTYKVSEDDEKWLREAVRRTYAELDASGDANYSGLFKTILKHEQNWVEWKNMSCPPLEHDPIPPETLQATQSKLQAIFDKKYTKFSHAMGTPVLSHVWANGYQGEEDLLKNKGVPDPNDLYATLQQQREDHKSLLADGSDSAQEAAHMAQKIKTTTWRLFRAIGKYKPIALSRHRSMDVDKIMQEYNRQNPPEETLFHLTADTKLKDVQDFMAAHENARVVVGVHEEVEA